MISKELLNVILNDNSIDFIDRELRNGEKVGYFSNRNREKKYIDIHRLAHKCKVWAYAHGYVLKVTSGGFYVVNIFFNGISLPLRFIEDTEPEAVFKATQYIYDNLSNL